jgi:rSAM/selenodomain-associated transferase 2
LSRASVAILIPALDEEEHLRELLPELVADADEVVVADGGSRDRTVELARELGATAVVGPPGRGRQLNRAAEASRSDVLVFLHADTRLPEGALDRVRRAVADGAAGGGFLVRFDSNLRIMALGSRLVNLRTRLTRAPLGDQAQFVTRAAFLALGGFREWPILEDLNLIRRLGRIGPIAVIPEPVVTSARRYEAGGVLRTVAVNWLIWLLYLFGAPPERLAGLYRNIR